MINICCTDCFSDGTEGSLVTCVNVNCICHKLTRNIKVEGLHPEMPTVTNEKGGKQSDTPYGFNELPPLALFAEAKVLAQGAKKYGSRNWIKIPIEDHLNHALQHIFAYLAGDKSDHHLANLSCRAHFALELAELAKQTNRPTTVTFEQPNCITCGQRFNSKRELAYECDTCFEASF